MFLMDLKLRSSFTLIILYVFNGFKIEIQLYTDNFVCFNGFKIEIQLYTDSFVCF